MELFDETDHVSLDERISDNESFSTSRLLNAELTCARAKIVKFSFVVKRSFTTIQNFAYTDNNLNFDS